ncbi:unnamed protein product [Caenorhabditis angaria]|uniref:Uncharacterized protein n=1 Tax=Caenorhabditis angaria TaxID=860376 RepID=A0A9P1IYN2_9PELO|nr:unnamed protein product [Caenorhabditis angaria]
MKYAVCFGYWSHLDSMAISNWAQVETENLWMNRKTPENQTERCNLIEFWWIIYRRVLSSRLINDDLI